jgi:hypothetical protein
METVINLHLKTAYSHFLNWSRYFSSKQHLSCTHEAEWTPFQTRHFSENLATPGIETGLLDL